jgi:hypothetical protein
MHRQAFEPFELVVKFWARLRIAVRQVNAANQNAVDGRFDVATLRIVRIAGEGVAREDRLCFP